MVPSGIGFAGKVYACDSSRGAAQALCLSDRSDNFALVCSYLTVINWFLFELFAKDIFVVEWLGLDHTARRTAPTKTPEKLNGTRNRLEDEQLFSAFGLLDRYAASANAPIAAGPGAFALVLAVTWSKKRFNEIKLTMKNINLPWCVNFWNQAMSIVAFSLISSGRWNGGRTVLRTKSKGNCNFQLFVWTTTVSIWKRSRVCNHFSKFAGPVR